MRITLPLAFPGLAAAAMYAFLGAWNKPLLQSLLLSSIPHFLSSFTKLYWARLGC